MGSSKLKRAIGAVKDQTSVGLAKVNGRSASLSELDVAIVKATRHEEYPAEEKYIREILSLTSYSRNYINACVNTLSRRLNKTKCWTVALKTLILIQRLLAEGDKAYEQEIFFATRRGTRLLNMSDFRDVSRSNSWDYSAFVRTYALYLDERLDYRMQTRHGKRGVYCVGGDTVEDKKDNPEADLSTAIVVRSQPIAEMKTEQIFTRIQHLQQLLDRFLACRPTGSARNNRVVIVALYPIAKESFKIYYDVTEIMGVLIERFMELDIPDSIKVYDIFCWVSKQFDELDQFYSWCRNMGIARSSEYPEIEKITQKKLDLMDEFIRDKSSLEETKQSNSVEADEEDDDERTEEVNEEQEDMNAIKALPAPPPKEEKREEEAKEEEVVTEEKKEEEVGDLLDLGDNVVAGEAGGDSLALALFDGPYASGSGSASGPGWEAFDDDSADWEAALVQSATNLSGQKTELGGGFDMLLLNGMYQHGTVNAAVQNSTAYGASGSASSMAFGSAGRPAATMLALPAPATVNGSSNGPVTMDPFAASLVVAPPHYVQMNDMEKKQRMLMEEQMMWDQYSRGGHTNLRPNQNQPIRVTMDIEGGERQTKHEVAPALISVHPFQKSVAITVGSALCVFDLIENRPVSLVDESDGPSHKDSIRAIRYGSSGKLFASAGDDKLVKIWSADSWHCLNTISSEKRVTAVAISSDDSYVCYADKFGVVWVVDLDGINEGKVLPSKKGVQLLCHYCSIITSLEFSPDGRYILSSDRDFKIRVTVFPKKSLQGAHEIQSFCLGHTEFVTCITFVQNPEFAQGYLMSGSGDSSVRLWDITTGSLLDTCDVSPTVKHLESNESEPTQVTVTDICALPNSSLAAVSIQRQVIKIPGDSFIPTSISFSTSTRLLWMVSGASNGSNHPGYTRVRLISRIEAEPSSVLEDEQVPGGTTLLEHLQGKVSIEESVMSAAAEAVRAAMCSLMVKKQYSEENREFRKNNRNDKKPTQ
ncbi:hypothetical protein IGI04_032806 [Brassica rapa subsp. trilocularis]|uniref:tRNA (guanine-N(7)-)-methyltransferase non-catalytic subunit n=1 Tax=Brassica rapa subsp. trilocularis TaxID=1813537 RepID=A0ABQ7LYW7_BRACM|nr:hypothetical protein IGI04_032806 [Brassica rapa subsp. trilocularis]